MTKTITRAVFNYANYIRDALKARLSMTDDELDAAFSDGTIYFSAAGSDESDSCEQSTFSWEQVTFKPQNILCYEGRINDRVNDRIREVIHKISKDVPYET